MRTKKLTQEQYLQRVRQVHGDKYNLDKVIYKNMQDKVEITCIKHGSVFVKAQGLLKYGGCKHCGKESTAMFKSALKKSEFIERVSKIHKYNFSKFEYKNNATKGEVICKVHGSFFITPANLLQGTGCMRCGKDKLRTLFADTTEDFSSKAKEVHDNKYDYSLVDYYNAHTFVKLICKEHGVFLQRPNAHLRGAGCPQCAILGFDYNKTATLYVLWDGELTKVGITSRTADQRCSELNTTSDKKFKVLYSFSNEDARKIVNLEKLILKFMSKKYHSCTDKFAGHTECFYDVDKTELINTICNLIKVT